MLSFAKLNHLPNIGTVKLLLLHTQEKLISTCSLSSKVKTAHTIATLTVQFYFLKNSNILAFCCSLHIWNSLVPCCLLAVSVTPVVL